MDRVIARKIRHGVLGALLAAAAPLCAADDTAAAMPVEAEEAPGDTAPMDGEANRDADDEAPATRALTSPRLASDPPDPLFADQRLLRIRLEGPIHDLARDSSPDPEELDAVMSWTTADGETGSLPIEYRARGKSRRRPEKCDFPPIRLDVPMSEADGTIFARQDKLKLVTHCKRLGSRSGTQEVWVWLEYYAYRVLNTLTDYSYRVRPLEVTYVDERGRDYTHPGFVLEHDERLAHRLGLEESEREQVTRDEMMPEITTVMEVFQYFLGNTDFSFVISGPGRPCCHNAVQFTDGDGRFVPIPYDFDQIGLLDKPDAVPAPDRGIRKVTDRRYRGFCRDPRYLAAALALFRENRAEIERILAEEVPDFGGRRLRKAQRFLDEFWEDIEDPRRVEREFADRCR